MSQSKSPTVATVAKAAGVSLSTVNRLLHGTGSVRPETVDRILAAADEVGFYGLGALQQRKQENQPQRRFAFLMQQSHRPISQAWARAVTDACARHGEYSIHPRVVFEDDLSPELVAESLLKVRAVVDAVAVVTADHPLVSHAIDELRRNGVPVVTFVNDLSAVSRAGHVGTDNWKIGRTAAWFISETAFQAGTVAVFDGSLRYQCQDFADASFRSYLRERAPQFDVLASLLTHEEPENAYALAKRLLTEQPDLRGIFVNGGGISGVLRALRECRSDAQEKISVVCRDIGPETTKGLGEGLITAALCLPQQRLATDLVDLMLDAVDRKANESVVQRIVPFEVVTPESLWG